MSQPTGTDPQSGANGQSQSGTGATDPNAATGTPAGTPGTDPAAPAATTTVTAPTAEEHAAVIARMQAADRTAAAANAALKKLQDAQLTEQQRKDAELEALKASDAEKTKALQEKEIENTFLKDSTYAWHNADAALKLLDMTVVSYADGKVSGMKAALDKLAKDYPWMVKDGASGTAPAGAQGGSGTGTTNQGSTGTTGTARQQGSGGNLKDWENTFPAMRGRVKPGGGS